MTPQQTAEKHVTIHAQPQGTVDVAIGGVVVKTFGGQRAVQAGHDFRDQLVKAVEKAIQEHAKEPMTSLGGNDVTTRKW